MQVERRGPTRAIVLERNSSHNQSWTGNARRRVGLWHGDVAPKERGWDHLEDDAVLLKGALFRPPRRRD
jgi:hypothetical protein